MTEKKLTLVAGGKTLKNNTLDAKIAEIVAGTQISLFHVEKQAEYDGIVMGVLENGLPYLSETGLAKLCGITRKALYLLSTNWAEEQKKPRGKAILEKLKEAGYTEPSLYIRCEVKGVPTNAFTEPVCMALLEYYAFEAKPASDTAIRAFRKLAKLSFRRFVYEGVGYNPQTNSLESWKYWMDRVDIVQNAIPVGYYCVFSEIAPIIVPLIHAGLIITDSVIPDISVGMLWSKAWVANRCDEEFGERRQCYHNYPSYYRQARSNPQLIYIYPDASLPAFRAWLRTYVESKFPKYLLDKVKQKAIPKERAATAIEAFKTTAALLEKK